MDIPRKNYYIVIILIICTVSDFYNYSNSITGDEFNEYVLENPNLIVYISDKYDLTHESFEKKFKNKIDKLNLKDKLIYIDKNDLTKENLKNIKEKYDISINKNSLPLILVINDKKVISSINIDQKSSADKVVEYEVFE